MDRTIFANFMNNIGNITPLQLEQLKQNYKPELNDFALLMVEKPWESPRTNQERASMLPFIQGIEKQKNNFNTYFATFVDDIDFAKIMSNDLCKTQEIRQIIYICAHGSMDTIGDGKADKIINTITDIQRSSRRQIEGLILGSCLAGGSDAFQSATKERGVNWAFGYKKSVGWMESAFIEMSIITELASTNHNYINDFDEIISLFARALRKFDPNWLVGATPSVKHLNVPLKETVVLHVRKKNDQLSWLNAEEELFNKIVQMNAS